jgi:hypothetical protein
VEKVERQKILRKIEAVGAAHDPEVEVAHGPEIPGIVDRLNQILGERGNRSTRRPTQAIQLVAPEVTLVGAAIGDKKQQRHG